MFNDVCGNWTVYHSLAVSLIAGLLIFVTSTIAITINEWLGRRADKKAAAKFRAEAVAVDPDTAYDHAIHGH
jgi:hypothetical protein